MANSTKTNNGAGKRAAPAKGGSGTAAPASASATSRKGAGGRAAGLYDRFGVTVDCVIFGFDEGDLKVALIRRCSEPFAGRWALPGGFVREGESLDAAARRELQEETGIGGRQASRLFLEQLFTFGDPHRDPRGQIVSVAHYALVKLDDQDVRATTDAADVAWFPAEAPPPLAFDHRKILAAALERLRGKVRYQPLGFELLPPLFKLTQLQHLYEALLGRPLDKRNFRRKVLSLGVLDETDRIEAGVAHRAARLYKFNRRGYDAMVKQGFLFEL